MTPVSYIFSYIFGIIYYSKFDKSQDLSSMPFTMILNVVNFISFFLFSVISRVKNVSPDEKLKRNEKKNKGKDLDKEFSRSNWE